MKSVSQYISDALMLLVIVPAILLAPYHHHDEPAEESRACALCEEHQPHPGHLAYAQDPVYCPVCHFLAQQYVPSDGPVADHPVSETVLVSTRRVESRSLYSPLLSHPRAPPVSFCSL